MFDQMVMEAGMWCCDILFVTTYHQLTGVGTSYNTEYSILHNNNRGQEISMLGRWKAGQIWE